jgi:hypothetical protein
MNGLLIIAPETASVIACQGAESQFADTYIVEKFEPESILQDLTDYSNKGIERALIVEKCLSGMQDAWVLVGDAINRSGTNPLRDISGDWPDPFLDLTNLYHVPVGASSITVTALGERAVQPDLPGPCCAYLHALAILVHRANIAASAVLVNPGTKVRLELGTSNFWESPDPDAISTRII